MKNKLISYSLIKIILIMFIFTGCQINTEKIFGRGNNESSAVGVQTVLNYYMRENSEKVNSIIDQFSIKYPNIKVKVNVVPDNMNTITSKLDVIAMGGGEMDIWPLTDGTQFLEMNRGLVRCVDDYIKKDGINMEKWFGSSAAAARYYGKYYGLPYRATVPMIFYNKDMFDEAGIPYPTDEWTYEDLYNISKKLTKGGGSIGNYKIYGFMQNWFMITGGRPGNLHVTFYGSDGLSSFLNQPYWEKTLKLRKKMEDEGLAMPYDLSESKGTYSSVEFFNERTAMTWGANWVVRDMKDKKRFPFNFNVGCVLPPRVDKNTENIDQISINESILAIPKTSKHPEEAWKFIEFYVQNGAEDIAQMGNIPLYSQVYSDKLIETFVEGSGLSVEDGRKFFSLQSRYDFVPKGVASTDYGNIIMRESGRYLKGQISFQQTMDNIKVKANQAILKEKNSVNK